MSESPEQTTLTRSSAIRCFKCGQYARPDANVCPNCGNPFAPRTIEADDSTGQVTPSRVPTHRLSPETDIARLRLLPEANIILQFLPTGACVTLTLEQPIILGRGTSADPDKLLDLTAFQALLYGVSRQHCKLERRGERLYVADLGSTNGTYYNDKRLFPFQEQAVGHEDRLIVGALHVVLRFSCQE
jgi:ribosomal protein L32